MSSITPSSSRRWAGPGSRRRRSTVPYNLNPIPPDFNQAKNAYYSSKQFFTGTGTGGPRLADRPELRRSVRVQHRRASLEPF